MTYEEDLFNRLLETFRKESLTDFQRKLPQYPEVERLLKTPLKDMNGTPNEKYIELLLPSDRGMYEDKTLLDVMILTSNLRLKGTTNNFEILYSYNDSEEPLGWFCYLDDRFGGISGIKMFSFGTNDTTFMRDVRDKFLELVKNNERISWTSTRTNLFDKHYIRAVLEYNGRCFISDNKEEITYYINKSKPNYDFSELERIFDKEMLRKAGYYKKINGEN